MTHKKIWILIKAFLVIAGIVFSIRIIFTFVPYKKLEQFKKRQHSTKFLDRNGGVIYIAPLDNGLRREYMKIKDIPITIKRIFIKAEDKRFFQHWGFDLIAISRSFFQNLVYKRTTSGASTITMQLSRLISPHPKTVKGKIAEIFNAFRLECKLSKNEILELWFNSIPYGYNAEGVATASKTFYGANLNELSIPQVLSLAVIPRSPVKYNPITNVVESKKAIKKLAYSLRMKINDIDIDNSLNSTNKYQYFNNAPHFVNFIQKNSNLSGEIKTSLDLKLQNFTNNRLNKYVEKNIESRITNGAVLVIKNQTGEIFCYLGSRDFLNKEYSGEIDGVHILRQPGSTLKPYLYAYAFENGFLPNDILPDIPTEFGNEKIYIPLNFNNRFNGPIRIRVALASSLNIPAVYIATKLGVKNFTQKLINWGFDSLKGKEDFIGSGIAIGDGEVSLYETTRAFSSFPRNGNLPNLTYLQKNEPYIEGKNIINEETASLICNILSDKKSRILGFGNSKLFDTSFEAMFKTGTSNQFNNIWAFGATTDFTVGVWMGDFAGNTIIGRAGSSVPAMLVVDVLKYLSEIKKPDDFKISKKLKQIDICSLSGKIPQDFCPHKTKEYVFLDSNIQKCDYHKLQNDKVVISLPDIYKKWVKSSHNVELFDTENNKYPEIISPNNNSVFYYDSSVSADSQAVKIEITNKNKNEMLTINVNGNFYKKLSSPFKFFFPIKRGKFNIEVIGNGGIDNIDLTVK
ncbi:MAG: hypothetical protein A2086_05795 [Spirochaetes bacterium GWD1_27_9]|nr:MAG: hypothetical protein A2Z98_04635 [Spirochaetes bacterium GWB1_27_13]OHD35290.1 MAG: hypothetical protein A2086_05795 [Spirochaetes bacterium GWD1_27_9]